MINKQHPTRESVDLVKKRKPYDRNWISSNSSTKKATRTNHIKERINKTWQKSRCRLCGDRDVTINHIISECSKFPQKEYKTRYNWLGKVIYCKLCQKFNFDNSKKGIWQPNISPGEWHTQTPLGFGDTNGSPNLDQTTRPYNDLQMICGLCCKIGIMEKKGYLPRPC